MAADTPILNQPLTAAELPAQLRRHAGEVSANGWTDTQRTVYRELMQMADLLDGGRGEDAHHGCPDPQVPTADCRECALVLEAEAEVVHSRFRGTDLVPAGEPD